MAQKQTPKQVVKAAPKPKAAKKPLTMRHLWRMTLWAATAAGALLLAVLATRSDEGLQRVAAVFSSRRAATQVAAAIRPIDGQAQTRQLAQAVRSLAAENDRLKARLAAVEENVSDLTGSVTRQIQAVKAETASPWPADAPPAPMTPAIIDSLANPPLPASAEFAAPPPLPSTVPESARQPAGIAAAVAAPAQYGVDVGSALSIEVLRARWLGIRSRHPQLFVGLTPTAMLRQVPGSKHVELRLVVGPLANSQAAQRLCAALAPYRLFCRPTPFDGRRVALR